MTILNLSTPLEILENYFIKKNNFNENFHGKLIYKSTCSGISDGTSILQFKKLKNLVTFSFFSTIKDIWVFLPRKIISMKNSTISWLADFHIIFVDILYQFYASYDGASKFKLACALKIGFCHFELTNTH